MSAENSSFPTAISPQIALRNEEVRKSLFSPLSKWPIYIIDLTGGFFPWTLIFPEIFPPIVRFTVFLLFASSIHVYISSLHKKFSALSNWVQNPPAS